MAFLWDPVTGVTDLGAPPGDFVGSRAAAINDRGEVVGEFATLEDSQVRGRAFIWDAASGLVALADDGVRSSAEGINDFGQIVGTLSNGPRTMGAFWASRDAEPVALPCFSPFVSRCLPVEINDRGDVLGLDDPDEENDPILWHEGVPYRLNDLLVDDDETVVFAPGLDDHGQIGATVFRIEPDGGLHFAPAILEPVAQGNQPPSCGEASPSLTMLWPPDHQMMAIVIGGVSDPDPGDVVTVAVTAVTSDEPPAEPGEAHAPDAVVAGDGTVTLRAERLGDGNGRVYEIHFTASDGADACSGSVTVAVPHDQDGDPAVDDGQLYDATAGV